ncbi:MAG: hypothetical protein JXB13_21160 [Phycisphaerae bacterium]|nr:hypothetical protein [Phycisphaerae bacterium]
MSELRFRPVRQARSPGYATRLEVLADATLLARHQPPGWLASGEIAAVAGLLLTAGTGGCSGSCNPGTAPRDPLARAAIVAPILSRGNEFRTMIMGDLASPFCRLSEDEALQLIREELNAAGLNMSNRNVLVEGVSVPDRENVFYVDWITRRQAYRPEPVAGTGHPLQADLEDPDRRVRIVYAGESQNDIRGGVWDSDYQDTARFVSQQVERSGKGFYFGAFYGPQDSVAYGEMLKAGRRPNQESSGKLEEALQAESKRLLRQQVKGFVDWLKGQGVI